MAGITMMLAFSPVLAIAAIVPRNWPAIRTHPVRWVIQLVPLALTLVTLSLAMAHPCKSSPGAQQPTCGHALAWATPTFWGIFGAQLLLAAVLAWQAPRRAVWIPIQLLVLAHAFWVTVGAILSTSGQWV